MKERTSLCKANFKYFLTQYTDTLLVVEVENKFNDLFSYGWLVVKPEFT